MTASEDPGDNSGHNAADDRAEDEAGRPQPPVDELLVLDERQLIRIEAVHRGFLYQHLYAAACLLLAGKAGAEHIIVEREDRKSTRLNPVTTAHLVCRLLLEKQNEDNERNTQKLSKTPKH